MKDNKTKIILILFFIIIILGCIFMFKILKGDNNEKDVAYSKSEVLDLIKSEDNKTNYEVEYTVGNIKYNKKYLNKKMKKEALMDGDDIISYFDFEKNTNTIIDEKQKIAIIQKINLEEENYMPKDILNIIEDPNCIIKKEEKISNRNAVVLSYNGKREIPNQFYFTSDKSGHSNDKIDEMDYNVKIWIDTETGLLLKTVITANNNEIETKYNLKSGSVTESEVTISNLSQYKVTDITSKQ